MPGRLKDVEAHEGAYALAQKSMSLCHCIATGTRSCAVYDRLRDKKAIVGGCLKDLVRVQIVALAHAGERACLPDEIEAWINQVRGIGKKEPHVRAALPT